MRIATLFVVLLCISFTYGVGVKWTISAAASMLEGNSSTTNYDFTISRNDTSVPVDIGVSTISTNNGYSANLTADLTALNNVTLSFNGEASQVVSVSIIGDTTYELDETFFVVLSLDPLDEAPAPFLATITNDENLPAVLISVPGAPAASAEGSAGPKVVTFTMTMNKISELPCTLRWQTQAGTALTSLDFVSKNGTTVFQPGASAINNTVVFIGDISDEPNEVFLIVNQAIGSVNCTVAPLQTIAIVDDDGPPNINITSASVVEGNSGVQLLNFLMNVFPAASGFSIVVNFSVIAGTATNNVDYVLPGGGVVIPAGAAQSNLWIRVVGEQLWEVDEFITINVTNVTNANLVGSPTVNGTIFNDDPVPLLSVLDASYTEGNADQYRTLNISTGAGFSAYPITVQWTLVEGTALEGVDYVAQNGTTVVVGSAGVSNITTVIGDTVAEDTNKTFYLVITNVACGSCPFGTPNVSKDTGAITIIDDDMPILYITGTTTTESSSNSIVFTVSISVAQGSDIIFD